MQTATHKNKCMWGTVCYANPATCLPDFEVDENKGEMASLVGEL